MEDKTDFGSVVMALMMQRVYSELSKKAEKVI
jgi:hypothetical protein